MTTTNTVDSHDVRDELATALQRAVTAAENKHGVSIPWLALVQIRTNDAAPATAIITNGGATSHNTILDARNALPALQFETFERPFEQ